MTKREKPVESGDRPLKPRANRAAKARASERQLLMTDHDLADIVSKAVANAIVTYERARQAQDAAVVSTGKSIGHDSDFSPSPKGPGPGVASEKDQTSTLNRLRQEMGLGDLDSLEFQDGATTNRSRLCATKSEPLPDAMPLPDATWAEPHVESTDLSEELGWLANELSHMASTIAQEPASRTEVRPREPHNRFQMFNVAQWLDRFRSALQVRTVGRAS